MRSAYFYVSTLSSLILFSTVTQANPNHGQDVNPASHAPAGVMAEHTHKAGEIMIGYRFMQQNYDQLYQGSEKITHQQLTQAGYSMAPTSMTMKMHMLDFMYALNDKVTLMLMPQYMSMDMDMTMLDSGSMQHDMGDMNHMDDMHDMHTSHQHGTSGWTDTQVSALVNLYQNQHHQVITNLGISLPTGSVDEKNSSGQFTHYGMQLGSGTYDFVPSVTYTGHLNALSWGAQLGANIKLEDENDSGFSFGDKYHVTGWLAYQVLQPLSISARLSYQTQEDIKGHYNGPHGHSAPSDIQANYGGQFSDLGLGFNYAQQTGPLKGVRLGLEWQTRVAQDYNGYQLGLDDGLNASLTYAF
ncbi:hypothetical protein [Catenovulum adriaticum]|uniref:Transporter n=1 Tax=Catenovulum adriaticum TaxID=2984846 RepID=A0ABY7APG7_9ALTE|nr:hypothetical protein [Catenovulum sp. TS8]WAJ71123.1 transporter [Catenovulum sp. TS8]